MEARHLSEFERIGIKSRLTDFHQANEHRDSGSVRISPSRQDVEDDRAMHVGEAIVAATMAVREAGVVKPH